MSKRLWTIKTTGYREFQMVLAMTYVQALAEARWIWPNCTIE